MGEDDSSFEEIDDVTKLSVDSLLADAQGLREEQAAASNIAEEGHHDTVELPGPAPAAPRRRSSVPRSDHPAMRQGVGKEPPGAACVLIGASGAGKTATLLGIGQACHIHVEGGPVLRFVGLKNVDELERQAVALLTKKKAQTRATTESKDYIFDVDVRHTGNDPSDDASMRFHICDGPGGALFPVEQPGVRTEVFAKYRTDLIEQGRSDAATALIICVNAMHPKSDLLRVHLPELLKEMCEYTDDPPAPRPWWRMFGRRSGRRLPTQRLALRFSRVLVLLTRMDQQAYAVVSQFGQEFAEDLGQCAGTIAAIRRRVGMLRAEELLTRIPPVDLAKELLGPPTLRAIWELLPPKGQLAVGLASPWGFDRATGSPLCDESGKPMNQRVSSGEAASHDILLRWRPTGLRDAVIFAATGKAGGLVELIQESDLSERWRGPEVELEKGLIRKDPYSFTPTQQAGS